MSDMIERVAIAIVTAGQERERERVKDWPHYAAGSFYATPWEDFEPERQQEYLDLARAAIEAMREPTNEMLQAMHEAMFEGKFTGSELPMLGAGFEAAIDASLPSPPETTI